MPPRIATAKALMPNSVPMVEEIVNRGATMMPATPARRPESAKEKVVTRSDVDPHQAGGKGVLHHGEQRLAVAGLLEEEMQREGKREADDRDQDLQQLDLEAGDGHRLRRQEARTACRAGPCRR